MNGRPPFVIERSVDLAAPPARVWRALTDPVELGQWFGSRAEFDATPGAAAAFEWPPGQVFHARVEQVDPPHFLSWRWAHLPNTPVDDGPSTLVEITLEPRPGNQTRLLLRESGFGTAEWYADNSNGWTEELADLAGHVSTPAAVSTPGAGPTRSARLDAVSLATEDPAALADFYARLFDLGTPRTEPDGMRGFVVGTSYLGFEPAAPPAAADVAPSRATIWFTVPDAVSAHAHALATGARPHREPFASGAEILATVLDPQRNVIGFVGPAPAGAGTAGPTSTPD